MSTKPYIIVLGNEKGGTGKSTTAMHILTALLNMGYKVGSLDVDARQGTFTKYVENRRLSSEKENGRALTLPTHFSIPRSTEKDLAKASQEDRANVDACLHKLADYHFVIIDTPGNDTPLARYAHSFADTLITPLNDSFVDLDVLAHVDGESLDIIKPSIYAEWVFEQKKFRAMRDRGSIDWIVLRNRLANIHSKNKQKMDQVLEALAKRLAFRQAQGFSERVIFRELFNQGLTLLDLKTENQSLNLSHVAARQELRDLMATIRLPQLQEKLASGL